MKQGGPNVVRRDTTCATAKWNREVISNHWVPLQIPNSEEGVKCGRGMLDRSGDRIYDVGVDDAGVVAVVELRVPNIDVGIDRDRANAGDESGRARDVDQVRIARFIDSERLCRRLGSILLVFDCATGVAPDRAIGFAVTVEGAGKAVAIFLCGALSVDGQPKILCGKFPVPIALSREPSSIFGTYSAVADRVKPMPFDAKRPKKDFTFGSLTETRISRGEFGIVSTVTLLGTT
jgi:hypothetical protein